MMYLLAYLMASAAPMPAAVHHGPDLAAIERIHAGQRDCKACNLAGADLTNQCVKEGNLAGANFDRANLTLMCMSYANFSNATFRGTNLSAANLAHAKLDGADFTGAILTITSVKGTDLTRVKGLTQKQLDTACGDAETKVPAGMTAKVCN